LVIKLFHGSNGGLCGLPTAVTALFLPFTAPLWSPDGIYFVLLIVLSMTSIVLIFKGLDVLSAWLAVFVGFVAVLYWWFAICRGSRPIWSDFGWFVVPELGFSIAGLGRWAIDSSKRVKQPL
jgi:hypothetical protein